jgi:hypothetical protein
MEIMFEMASTGSVAPGWEFLDKLSDYQLLKDCVPRS